MFTTQLDHRDYYNQGSVEVIDVIVNWELDFCLGNAFKYIARAGYKKGANEKDDLEKAARYLRFEIDKVIYRAPLGFPTKSLIEGMQLSDEHRKIIEKIYDYVCENKTEYLEEAIVYLLDRINAL